MIDHLVVKLILLSLSCQMYFDNSVLLESFLWAGAHLEPTTLLCSCNGVFTSKVIFRLNFPLIRLPQEPDDQLQEIKLTS